MGAPKTPQWFLQRRRLCCCIFQLIGVLLAGASHLFWLKLTKNTRKVMWKWFSSPVTVMKIRSIRTMAKCPGRQCLFSNRDAKTAASEKFGVRGIPMLVVCRPDGTVVSDNGRGAVATHQDLGKALEEWGV